MSYSSLTTASSICSLLPVRMHAHALRFYLETHKQYDDGVPSGLLRLSIGVEDSEDLIADLEQGLNAVMGKRS